MTAEQVDRIMEEVRTFSDKNFGLQNGWDFPEFARALSQSENFKTFIFYAAGTMMLQCLDLRKDSKPEDVEKLATTGDSRRVMAVAMYVGYRLGQEVAETRQLEKMAK